MRRHAQVATRLGQAAARQPPKANMRRHVTRLGQPAAASMRRSCPGVSTEGKEEREMNKK